MGCAAVSFPMTGWRRLLQRTKMVEQFRRMNWLQQKLELLFGTTQKLEEATENLGAFPTIAILRLRNVTALDATGIHALEVFAGRLRKTGRTLLLCGARDQPAGCSPEPNLWTKSAARYFAQRPGRS